MKNEKIEKLLEPWLLSNGAEIIYIPKNKIINRDCWYLNYDWCLDQDGEVMGNYRDPVRGPFYTKTALLEDCLEIVVQTLTKSKK